MPPWNVAEGGLGHGEDGAVEDGAKAGGVARGAAGGVVGGKLGGAVAGGNQLMLDGGWVVPDGGGIDGDVAPAGV